MKKYTIELTEKQARLLSWACDTLPRLMQGQSWTLQELLESAWEKRCKEATGKMMDEEFEGGWSAMRKDAENTVREIKRRFWNLGWNYENGIHYDDSADILFDIYTVIRHQLWKDKPEDKKYHSTVDAFQAHQFGSEPLIKIESKED